MQQLEGTQGTRAYLIYLHWVIIAAPRCQTCRRNFSDFPIRRRDKCFLAPSPAGRDLSYLARRGLIPSAGVSSITMAVSSWSRMC